MKVFLMSLLAVCVVSFRAGADGTNVMPAGFENVFLGMTTQQLQVARSQVDLDARKNLGNEALEIITNSVFFKAVDYVLTTNQTVEIVTFWPRVNDQSPENMKGFINGCIVKYGSGYEKRFYMQSFAGTETNVPVSLLKWTFAETNVVASFVSPAARAAFLEAGGTDIFIPYQLAIFQTNAISHGILLRYFTNSLPAEQDTSGQAFTNFPAFVDSYNGPIWE